MRPPLPRACVRLADLPLFFGCLLLHQRRATVDEDAALPASDEALDRLLVDESIQRLRSRGRELCIHEHVVTGGGNSTEPARCPIPHVAEMGSRVAVHDGAEAAEGAARVGAAGGLSAARCPVVVAEQVAETVGRMQAQQQPPQPQPQQ